MEIFEKNSEQKTNIITKTSKRNFFFFFFVTRKQKMSKNPAKKLRQASERQKKALLKKTRNSTKIDSKAPVLPLSKEKEQEQEQDNNVIINVDTNSILKKDSAVDLIHVHEGVNLLVLRLNI